MYWRVQQHWSHDPRFNAENFAFQPVRLILQALEWGAKLNQEQLHQQELGIATLSSLFVNVNRDPKKGDPAKPADFFYFKRSDEEVKISPVAADCFFSLAIDQNMPFWVPGFFGRAIEKLRSARANGAVPRDRGWFGGEQVALFAPQIRGDRVFVPLGAICDCSGVVTVECADTGARYAIDIPKGEPRWFVDQVFELVSPP